VRIESDLLAKNDALASVNRQRFRAQGSTTFNLIGAPGAGKTLLLERTIRRLSDSIPIAVLEGDQETDNDAARIRSAGAPVRQINTGTGCHLDARMVATSIEDLGLDRHARSILFIENVGNLVCPALFDLGEEMKVVIMSVTEGEDKPLKYPHVFRASGAAVLTKYDLLPHLDFDLDACLSNIQRINPELTVFTVSARTGAGLDLWCGWLRDRCGAFEPHAVEGRAP
jgi:hydrogenase nickel incorporation protein HypB